MIYVKRHRMEINIVVRMYTHPVLRAIPRCPLSPHMFTIQVLNLSGLGPSRRHLIMVLTVPASISFMSSWGKNTNSPFTCRRGKRENSPSFRLAVEKRRFANTKEWNTNEVNHLWIYHLPCFFSQCASISGGGWKKKKNFYRDSTLSP